MRNPLNDLIGIGSSRARLCKRRECQEPHRLAYLADLTEATAWLQQLKADVVVCDPHVDPARSHATAGATWVELTAEEIRAADAVVLLVDHDAFDLDLIAAEATYVLDTRRCITGPTVEHL